ncbi:MAG: hypothetical protein II984_08770 [Clostridia bacterium]|nr:hypothetical protein [Clostridia bacterium]
MDFAVSIIELVKSLKEKRESIISNQIGRSGTSIRVMLISSINTSKQGRFSALLCYIALCRFLLLCVASEDFFYMLFFLLSGFVFGNQADYGNYHERYRHSDYAHFGGF